MNRILEILLAVAATVGAFAAVEAWLSSGSDPLVDPKSGQVEEAVFASVHALTPEPRQVVWMGDSTIWPYGAPTYPVLVAGQVLFPARVPSVTVAGPAFNFFHHYCLMGPVVQVQPTLVVIVLNLRTFGEKRVVPSFLCSRLPRDEWLPAIVLPTGEAGLPFPHLLLAQSLRVSWVRRAGGLLNETRDRVDQVRAGAGLPPRLGYSAASWRLRRTAEGQTPGSEDSVMASWRVAAYPPRDSEAMLDATVRLGRSRGGRVLVVVSPAPMAGLRAANAWDGPGGTRLLERMRTAVEARGAEFADLHDLLDDGAFLDGDGFSRFTAHLKPRGVRAVADRLAPTIARLAGVEGRGGLEWLPLAR